MITPVAFACAGLHLLQLACHVILVVQQVKMASLLKPDSVGGAHPCQLDALVLERGAQGDKCFPVLVREQQQGRASVMPAGAIWGYDGLHPAAHLLVLLQHKDV
jgi:hypothetical protein